MKNMKGEHAVIIGGFSESPECLAPLTNEFSKLFSDIEQLTWTQAYRRRHTLARDVMNRTVITHSAGAMYLHCGERGIALSGVEPTHPIRSVVRAGHVAYNTLAARELENPMSLRRSAHELLHHPDHLRVLGRVGMFSTAERLIRKGAEGFPGGRYYLPSERDEFGFTRPDMIARAAEHGIVTGYVGRLHNDPITNPRNTVTQIKQLLEVKSAA